MTGLAEKRRAVLEGALRVFARDGYTRARIDVISARAGVSTRTIYNHFQDKAELFRSVIQESAARAAEAQIAIIDRHLRKVTDLEADLVDLGRDLVAMGVEEPFADHFGLVRQINAEIEHIPPAAIEAWQATGPMRVLDVLASHLARLGERGLLRTDDPRRTATHLMLLISVYNPSMPSAVPSEESTESMVTAGVRAFLYGYAAR